MVPTTTPPSQTTGIPEITSSPNFCPSSTPQGTQTHENQLKTIFIGVSLSEPHTSGTVLRKCVNVRACLLAAIYRTRNECIQIFHEDRSCAQSMLSGLLPCPSAASVTWREVKARVATYFWFVLLPTINGRSLTGGTSMDSG